MNPQGIYKYIYISIHALREEGDCWRYSFHWRNKDFYPRPPRGGRHKAVGKHHNGLDISIHALREEGDDFTFPKACVIPISIHALREEGDVIVGG